MNLIGIKYLQTDLVVTYNFIRSSGMSILASRRQNLMTTYSIALHLQIKGDESIRPRIPGEKLSGPPSDG